MGITVEEGEGTGEGNVDGGDEMITTGVGVCVPGEIVATGDGLNVGGRG